MVAITYAVDGRKICFNDYCKWLSSLYFFGRRALSRKEWLNLLCERRRVDGEEELDLCSRWIKTERSQGAAGCVELL